MRGQRHSSSNNLSFINILQHVFRTMLNPFQTQIYSAVTRNSLASAVLYSFTALQFSGFVALVLFFCFHSMSAMRRNRNRKAQVIWLSQKLAYFIQAYSYCSFSASGAVAPTLYFSISRRGCFNQWEQLRSIVEWSAIRNHIHRAQTSMLV